MGYDPAVNALLLVYAAGVVVGLLRGDGPAPAKVALAVLWPVGAAAGVVTLAILLAAAGVLFPVVGSAMAAGLFLVWWLW